MNEQVRDEDKCKKRDGVGVHEIGGHELMRNLERQPREWRELGTSKREMKRASGHEVMQEIVRNEQARDEVRTA
jgi:hypothetical protein